MKEIVIISQPKQLKQNQKSNTDSKSGTVKQI